MNNAQSGISVITKSGDIYDLTFDQLIETVHEVQVHPDLLLDVQTDMMFEFARNSFSAQEIFGKIKEFTIERMSYEGAEERFQLPEDKSIDEISDHDLEKLIIAMFVRLQAADELQTKPWMKLIFSKSVENSNILQALGEYWSKASLVYSRKLHTLVFDESLARKSLRTLARKK